MVVLCCCSSSLDACYLACPTYLPNRSSVMHGNAWHNIKFGVYHLADATHSTLHLRHLTFQSTISLSAHVDDLDDPEELYHGPCSSPDLIAVTSSFPVANMSRTTPPPNISTLRPLPAANHYRVHWSLVSAKVEVMRSSYYTYCWLITGLATASSKASEALASFTAT